MPKTKQKFKVWCTWQEYGYQEVEAESKADAEEIAQQNCDDFTLDDSPFDDYDWHIVSEMTQKID